MAPSAIVIGFVALILILPPLPCPKELVVISASLGALLGQLINLEALLSLPQGEIVDPNTNKKRLIPPKIVMDRDEWELDNLPFLPDRQHHCATWMMWHVLGLPRILERLFAGEEYSAKDPELIKLSELAHSYRDNIKSVLGFWIPDNSSPSWILGVFLGKMGLKTASRKKGSAGQQVKYYSLAVEEYAFATQVLEYRHEQKLKREERKLQREEENRLHQMMMETQYGITPNSISTPARNKNIANKQEGVNMAEIDFQSVLNKTRLTLSILDRVVNLGAEVVEGFKKQQWNSFSLISELISYLNAPMMFVLNRPTKT